MSSCSQTIALAIPSFSASSATFGSILCLLLSVHDGVDIPSKSEMMPKSLGFAGRREGNVGDVGRVSLSLALVGEAADVWLLEGRESHDPVLFLPGPGGRILPARASYSLVGARPSMPW